MTAKDQDRPTIYLSSPCGNCPHVRNSHCHCPHAHCTFCDCSQFLVKAVVPHDRGADE